MIARHERVHPCADGRLIAISDIHGHLSLFDKLLGRIALTPRDTLIVVGDMCERGNESLGMIRRAMELRARGNAHFMMGNVDINSLSAATGKGHFTCAQSLSFLRRMFEGCGCTLFHEMCAELGMDAGKALEGETELARAQQEICGAFRSELEFMASLPTFITAGQYAFVHGGAPSCDFDRYAGLDAWPFLKRDAFIDSGTVMDRYTIVGHWPAALYRSHGMSNAPYIERRQRIIDIDGGVGIRKMAQLNALILPAQGEDFSWLSVDECRRYRALDAQQCRPDTIYIRWGHCDVDVISEQGDTALVRHIESGRILPVPTCMLYDREPGCARCHCGDISDGEIEVRPGDELGVAAITSLGAIAKRGDDIGWYMGRIEPVD